MDYEKPNEEEFSDLLEILWLQQLADKLGEFYRDVRVDTVFGDGDREPMIFIHDIPVTVDDVDRLLLLLPYELRLAKEEVLYDLDSVRHKVEIALQAHKNELIRDLEGIEKQKSIELKAVGVSQQDQEMAAQSSRAEKWRRRHNG